MTPTLDAALLSWPVDPWLWIGLLLTAGVYLRGWLALRRRTSVDHVVGVGQKGDDRVGHVWRVGQLLSFLGGLLAIFLALASPLESFATLLLQAHMAQHLLLMMVAPALLWWGEPLLPLLRGLPRAVRRDLFGPLMSSRGLRRLFAALTHPAVALPLFIAAVWLWHAPGAYELALRSPGWHYVQHACFLATGMLFWYPVVRPFPARPRWSTWVLIPYLLLADVQNTVLSALLTFSDRPLYPHYEAVPRILGITPLADQAAAGVLMWVPGSLVFLIPLFVIALRKLYGRSGTAGIRPGATGNLLPVLDRKLSGSPVAQSSNMPSPCRSPSSKATNPISTLLQPEPAREYPVGAFVELQTFHSLSSTGGTPVAPTRALGSAPRLGSEPFDVTRLLIVGQFLRWRHARIALQLPLLLLAVAMIWDGLRGPRVAPMNLAGVLPWIHWRGLLVLGMLAAGNVFCMACPFTLPRTLARRWLPAGLEWPRRLRSKWLAVGLVVLFLWSYEAFALWDSPWWTAWIAIGYFAVAFAIDGLFRGGTFCKYVCPIGQFNFVQSLISPLEVAVRDGGVCTTCVTRDCICGNDRSPGCELQLFQPQKAGNLDCTWCLACVHACPTGNVGLLTVPVASGLSTDRSVGVPASAGNVGVPASAGLPSDRFRSGIGRLSRRTDLAALVLVLVFGAFANSAGMVGPVVAWQDRLSARLGQQSPLLAVSLFYVTTIILLPLACAALAGRLSRRWGTLHESTTRVATRFAYALVPLGFAMWLAHYTFHFFTSYETIIPVTQRFAADLGLSSLGPPQWACACCRPAGEWLLQAELVALGIGLLASLHTAHRIAHSQTPAPRAALGALAPWAFLIVLLFIAGVWIVLQPMQMRGTLPAIG
jgi:cytochrome c oxidase assembly factor CtaG